MTHPFLTGSPEERAAAIAALAARVTPPDAGERDALRDCLGDARKLVQRTAAEAFASLARRGVDVQPQLLAALAAGDLRLRWGAAYALALADRLPADALPTLLEVMALDDGDLRWAAMDLVKRLAIADRARAVAAVLAAARTPGAPRKMALYCLRDLEVTEAADVALDALADPHFEIRLAALSLLARVHPDRAGAAHRIVALIDDPDARIGRAAAGTLGDLGVADDVIRAALERAEHSSDPSLRRAAKHSLRALVKSEKVSPQRRGDAEG